MKKHIKINGRIACNGNIPAGKWEVASKDYYATCRSCLRSITRGRQLSMLDSLFKPKVRAEQLKLDL
jgi:hypothetical protein